MEMAKVQININASGQGSVLLDGKDISSNVSGLNVRIRAGELTRVFLVLAADTEIETDAEIRRSSLDGRTTKSAA
jgi:hypothetical protein